MADADRLALLRDSLATFAEERNWGPVHSPRNLAMALAAESGELLAEFLWLSDSESEAASLDDDLRSRITDEIADVMIYLTRLAGVLHIDLVDAANEKMRTNATRFPREQ